MVDDKTNQPENQLPDMPAALQPEETPPELTAPEPNLAPIPAADIPMPETDHKARFFIVGGAVIFFIVIFGLILSLIFGSRNTKKTNVTLEYWGLWEDSQTYQPLIDAYEKQHPNVKINYTKMVPQDYREKLLARSQEGKGPDIFRFHNTWLPELSNLVSPIPTSIMSVSDYEKTFYPITKKDLKIGENYYGIPLMIDGLVLVYNDDLFKKAGISSPPISWEDIINYAGKLTVKDGSGTIATSGIALGTAANVEHFSDIFGLFLLQNGGDIHKLDQPEAAGALESYRKFAEPSIGFWDETMPNSLTAFTQEKVAMIIIPSWEILSIKSMNPNIQLKVIPVPVIPGSKPLSIANYWVEGVSQKSINQIEAWNFLKYLSEKDSLTKIYEIQSKTRLFGYAYSRVDLAPLLTQNEYLAPVIKQAQEGDFTSIPLISRTYDNGLNDNLIVYIQNAINQTEQGVSYSEALQTAKQGVDQVSQNFKF